MVLEKGDFILRLSTRARYGLRAMVDLAQHYSPDDPVPLSQIAERQKLSEGYLEQLMTFLRKGRLVRSLRGAQGGYILVRKPDSITIGEILRCLEGSLSPTECVDEEICERAGNCPTRLLWKRINDSIKTVIDNTTLEELCKQSEN
ncbi:MAG: hypothetical protein PWP31_1407 [Clostridia bacterium]|nr:hypothetical protein [Clostridia bacterium]